MLMCNLAIICVTAVERKNMNLLRNFFLRHQFVYDLDIEEQYTMINESTGVIITTIYVDSSRLYDPLNTFIEMY